jgi:hypothetical protein
VLSARPPSAYEPAELSGRADLGRTAGRVLWVIEPAGEGSEVTLAAWLERATLRDRLLLALGGRRLLQRIFENALVRLQEVA